MPIGPCEFNRQECGLWCAEVGVLTELLQTCRVWAEAPVMLGERVSFGLGATERFELSRPIGKDFLNVRVRKRLVNTVTC